MLGFLGIGGDQHGERARGGGRNPGRDPPILVVTGCRWQIARLMHGQFGQRSCQGASRCRDLPSRGIENLHRDDLTVALEQCLRQSSHRGACQLHRDLVSPRIRRRLHLT